MSCTRYLSHPPKNIMLTKAKKRVVEVDDTPTSFKVDSSETWPLLTKLNDVGEHTSHNVLDVEHIHRNKRVCTQNIHPSLAMYKCDEKASSNVSWTHLQQLLNPDEELALYDF